MRPSIAMPLFAALSLLVVLVLATLAHAAPPNAKVTQLPGVPAPPSFDMYAGYVTVDATAGRNLFYWLVEAQTAPHTAPLVLWMNGGPGCSSLFGFLTEHGPYRVNDDGKTLSANAYSWNRAANMLYLEAPAGVGFSYALDGNYTTGDDDVAANNYRFLLGFFEQYPEYQGRPFYIAGESYAGHYVPQVP